ncbi:MAG: hypothetical protein AB8C40_05470 [Gammaproteobacteria bacterium]
MLAKKIELKLEDENNNDYWTEISVEEFFSISATNINELISQNRIKIYDENKNLIPILKLGIAI